MKADNIDNTHTSDFGYVHTKFYLQKQDVAKYPFSLEIRDFRVTGL